MFRNAVGSYYLSQTDRQTDRCNHRGWIQRASHRDNYCRRYSTQREDETRSHPAANFWLFRAIYRPWCALVPLFGQETSFRKRLQSVDFNRTLQSYVVLFSNWNFQLLPQTRWDTHMYRVRRTHLRREIEIFSKKRETWIDIIIIFQSWCLFLIH